MINEANTETETVFLVTDIEIYLSFRLFCLLALNS